MKADGNARPDGRPSFGPKMYVRFVLGYRSLSRRKVEE